MNSKPLLLFLILLIISTNNPLIANSPEIPDDSKKVAAGCIPATSHTDLDINNVRARINVGGSLWWDLQQDSHYEIPKGSGRNAMFSGSYWISGIDANDQIKVAAHLWNQVGFDFWAGPLSVDGTASTDGESCEKYDRLWKINKTDITEFLDHCDPETGEFIPTNEYLAPPEVIRNWPWRGDISKGQTPYLAPFFDVDNDGKYDWKKGDYPMLVTVPHRIDCEEKKPTKESAAGITLNGSIKDQALRGDQCIWWVFNDKGNTHTETQGEPMGLEIRAQAYAFATEDEINNVTFYSYELINRSSYRLNDVHFAQWVDTDVGYQYDDYIGCDVSRGLGYAYNGSEVDGYGQAWAFGNHPPAVGIDYFQGPYFDPDGKDNPMYSFQTYFQIQKLYNIDPNSGDTLIFNINTNGDTLWNPPVYVTDPNTGSIIDTTYLYWPDTIGSNIIRELVCGPNISGQNFGDGIVDNERMGMQYFLYIFKAPMTGISYPSVAIDFHRNLRGIWKNGQRIQYGGRGYGYASYGPDCRFMFPGDSDPCNWGTGGILPNGPKNWTEPTSNNNPYDRNLLSTVGPFTLESGGVNYISLGIPWARATAGGAWASVELLKIVDDKCQKLFDNCFQRIEGPDAPDLIVQEMDKELILYLENRETNSNYNEDFEIYDYSITFSDTLGSNERGDSTYNFEGYMIFQLSDENVSISDVTDPDPDKVRLVGQCDIKNGISKIINHELDLYLEQDVPKEKVNGQNEGIRHSFRITEDQFATGNKRLVNNKKYYFIAIAYAHNEYQKYVIDPSIPGALFGQKRPFLSSSKSQSGGAIESIVAIPHIPEVEAAGTQINAQYGDGPKIKRIEGHGNCGMDLDLTQESVEGILSASTGFLVDPIYKNGHGPIDVRVIDPLNVKSGKFVIKLIDTLGVDSTHWIMIYNDGEDTVHSRQSITVYNEQLVLDYGISITIHQQKYPGDHENGINNGFITSDMHFADSSKRWLFGLPDSDGSPVMNWIRSGSLSDEDDEESEDIYVMQTNPVTGHDVKVFLDPNEDYEKIIGGIWAPYRLCSRWEHGPARSYGQTNSKMKNLYSIDIVFTADQSKWTRCPVIEMCEDNNLAEGQREKFTLRGGQSVDKNGNTGTPEANDNGTKPTGMGWFPGYAINLETGERLNIAFGEDSWQVGDKGRDMLWNPTSNLFTNLGNVIFGGKHYIYIFGHNQDNQFASPAYDEGEWLYQRLSNASAADLIRAYNDAMWVGIPLIDNDFDITNQTDIPTDVKVRIRVSRPFEQYFHVKNGSNNPQNNDYPMYEFTLDDLATGTEVIEIAKSALDLINVVPNPYYAYSAYETNQLDNKVKITNLPERCTVSIFTTNGTLVRRFKKDNQTTWIEWDLKNHAGIPIAGGMYIIHINAPGIGEKTIKWFGTLRPVDMQGF